MQEQNNQYRGVGGESGAIGGSGGGAPPRSYSEMSEEERKREMNRMNIQKSQ